MIPPWCIITMLHTMSIIAQKGGSGKTTLALTLAVAVEQASRTAVVLDIDSQATACKWSARRAADTPLVLAVQPARLPGALATTAAHDVDVVVIDTPARSEHAALEAARVADLVIIPCRPQLYDLETIPETLQVLSLAGGVSAVVVLSGVAARGPRTDQARTALTSSGLRVCPATLGYRAVVGDAGALGLTATEFQPRGLAAQEARHVAQWITEILATGGTPDG